MQRLLNESMRLLAVECPAMQSLHAELSLPGSQQGSSSGTIMYTNVNFARNTPSSVQFAERLPWLPLALWRHQNQNYNLTQFNDVPDFKITVPNLNSAYDDNCMQNAFTHELLHGVGFYSLVAQNFGSRPGVHLDLSIFDTLIKISTNNESIADYILTHGLTSLPGKDAYILNHKVYNPNPARVSSSLSHLDNPTSLMASALHVNDCTVMAPGNGILAIVNEMGWMCANSSSGTGTQIDTTYDYSDSQQTSRDERDITLDAQDQSHTQIHISLYLPAHPDANENNTSSDETSVAIALFVVGIFMFLMLIGVVFLMPVICATNPDSLYNNT